MIKKQNVIIAFEDQLNNNFKYYKTMRGFHYYFMGVVLGLKIADAITDKEYKYLKNYMKKRLTIKEYNCFHWFWQKHKHTKECYEYRYLFFKEIKKKEL